MKSTARIVILSVLLLAVIQLAQAAGISVDPSVLHFNLQAGSPASQAIVIENISSQPVIYNLYVDEMEDEIFPEPTNFRLEAFEKKRVKVRVQPKKAGSFATNLSIVAQDLDRRKFNVSAGVKVPITLEVSPAPIASLSNLLKKVIIVSLPVLIVVLIGALLIKRKRKRWYQRLGGAAINLIHHKRPWWKIW